MQIQVARAAVIAVCVTGIVGARHTFGRSSEHAAGNSTLRPSAPQQTADPPVQPRFSTSIATVVVDVVVRDRSQRPVVDLTVGDFEVYEDGTRQDVTTFDAVVRGGGEEQASSDAGADGAATRPREQGPRVTALVFEQLGTTGRQLASHAADVYVKDVMRNTDFTGVFALDRALHVLAPYTNDRAALEAAIAQASLRAGYARERSGQVPSAEYGTVGPDRATIDDDPYTRAHATFAALDRLIDGLRAVPGRKAVVFFSQGLALDAVESDPVVPRRGEGPDTTRDSWLDDTRRDAFLRVIANANRHHVSFYTFDAGGFRAAGLTRDFGRDPYVGLQFLAEQTGGAFVENTNRLVEGVQRLGADFGHYYLLGYVPRKSVFDGRYRQIRVKVKRPGVSVLARQGYRATRERTASTVRSYEVAPLLVLDGKGVPNAFDMQIGAFGVPGRDKPGRTAIVARVPVRTLPALGVDDQPSTHRAVTILARVRDTSGGASTYASDRYQMPLPKGERAEAGSGDLLFYRELELPAGVHSLEIAVYDEMTALAAVRLRTIEVPKPAAGGLQVGSIIMLDSGRSLARGPAGAERLRMSTHELVPDLSEIAGGAELPLVFSACVAPGTRTPLRATISILADGQPRSSATLDIPDIPEDGCVSWLGRVPIETLPPGTYQIALTVEDGSVRVNRIAVFRRPSGP